MLELSVNSLRLAGRDLAGGFFAWRIWYLLATQDIRQRYRRSTFGPLWATLSVSVQVLVMGFLVGTLFGQPVNRYLPYVVLGYVLWNFIINTLTEGSMTFIASGGFIQQFKHPLFSFILQMLWRNCINFAHTAVIYIIVAFIFDVKPHLDSLLVIPGLILIVINLGWVSLLLALMSTRFRDIPMILQNALTVLFWVTPVVYYPSQLGSRKIIAQLSPVTHLIDIVRLPLLGEPFSELNWSVALGMAILGWLATFLVFARFRARVPYWL